MDTTTSAPGKLFLFGEYGVLAGGWSVVAAVDRRVIAQRREEASGYEARGADLDDATALPRTVLAELSLAELSLAELSLAELSGAESGSASSHPFGLDQLATDIRQLFTGSSSEESSSGEKLGLGSSAASSVALTAACLPESADLDRRGRAMIFERAFAAHRRLQGGRGSCADVAASAFGGIIGYRLRQPCAPFAACTGPDFAKNLLSESVLTLEPAQVCACRPLPVRVEPIWLGHPAVSTSFVGRCEEALGRESQGVQNALCRSAEIAAGAIEALQRQDARQLLELVTQADHTLEQLGELIQAPIVTDAHRALREHATRAGLRVKPSGAGGGDFSLVFGPADASWEPFLAQLPDGLRHLPMALGADGVRRER